MLHLLLCNLKKAADDLFDPAFVAARQDAKDFKRIAKHLGYNLYDAHLERDETGNAVLSFLTGPNRRRSEAISEVLDQFMLRPAFGSIQLKRLNPHHT